MLQISYTYVVSKKLFAAFEWIRRFASRNMKIKKGDQVKIIAGKDRGKTATVTAAFPKENKITVEGVNLYRKRVKPRQAGQKGEMVVVARPFSASNAMIVCPNCKTPSRIGHRAEANQKIRYCKKCRASV